MCSLIIIDMWLSVWQLMILDRYFMTSTFADIWSS